MKNIIENEKYKLEIFDDLNPCSPREFDNLGTMVCFHRRYNLGDETELKSSDFSSWEELESYLYKEENALIAIPVFMYDHSGLWINTTGFSCPWDSGQVGYIYVSKEKVRREYSCKRISKKLKNMIREMLCSEVDLYNDYLCGNVYGFTLTDKENAEEIDSSCGFYGTDYVENGIFDYVSSYFTKAELEALV
jgi:hypothetical protein